LALNILVTMELNTFIGTWINKAGNRLEIKIKDNKSLNVSFFTQGKTPVVREYYNNLESLDMHAELDYYESSIEVELWEKGKGFHLCLLYDFINLKVDPGYYLAPGISRYVEDDFLDKYYHLFEPLDYYKKVE
jgi:hypothetical protein